MDADLPQGDEAKDIEVAVGLCRAAHERLLAAVRRLPEESVGRPSLLPGWTVGHVLTHLARNAEGHARRLEGALRGEEVPRYPGGPAQRDADIEAGAGGSVAALVADVATTAEHLEEVWSRSAEAGWPNRHLLADDRFPTTGSPRRRLREVEVHHVDLGIGYMPEDWPEGYVQWELPRVLERLPGRIQDPAERRRLLAWLIGRADQPAGITLDPWA